MKKNINGVTLVILVVTIIILFIISGITLYSGTSLISKAKLRTLNTNMLLIQAKINIIAERVNFDKENNSYVGTNIEISEITNLINNGILLNSENDSINNSYYYLTKEDLNSMGLENIAEKDNLYIVNYVTEEVIYKDGYKDDNGNTYYRLSQISNMEE